MEKGYREIIGTERERERERKRRKEQHKSRNQNEDINFKLQAVLDEFNFPEIDMQLSVDSDRSKICFKCTEKQQE